MLFFTSTWAISWKEGILDVQLFCYSSLIRSASQSQRKRDQEGGSDVGRSRVGGHSAFAILTIKPDSDTGQLQPCFPTTYAWYWVCILALPPSPHTVVPSRCAWRNHWCPPPPASVRKVIKGTTLATCRCYVNRLSWGTKQESICHGGQVHCHPNLDHPFLDRHESLPHCCRSSNSGICPSLPWRLEPKTTEQSHLSAQVPSPVTWELQIYMRTTFYEEGQWGIYLTNF